MRYYYVYTITCDTITQLGVATREKITKHITPNNLCDIKILSVHDNFSMAIKHCLRVAEYTGLKLLPSSAVICNETGDIFLNAEQAAKWAKVDRGNMSNHLRGLRSVKTLNKKTFRYLNK